MRPRLAVLLLAAAGWALAGGRALGDERAVYRATGPDAALAYFDQYDNDGYSLAVSRGPGRRRCRSRARCHHLRP